MAHYHHAGIQNEGEPRRQVPHQLEGMMEETRRMQEVPQHHAQQKSGGNEELQLGHREKRMLLARRPCAPSKKE